MEKTITTTIKPTQVVVEKSYLNMLELSLKTCLCDAKAVETREFYKRQSILIEIDNLILPILPDEIVELGKLLSREVMREGIPQILLDELSKHYKEDKK